MAVPSTIRKSLFMGTITIPLANTNYELVDLINTAIAVQTGNSAVTVSRMAREVLLQANPGVDASGTNTNDILVGDGALSASNYGFVISPGSSVPFRSDSQNVFLGGLYVRSAGVSQKINVSVFGA